MTEDDAKSKWCPFIRFQPRTSEQHAFSNRAAVITPAFTDDQVDAETKCIGSACMAWRWKYRHANNSSAMTLGWPPVEPIYERTEHGYCGLAGSSH